MNTDLFLVILSLKVIEFLSNWLAYVMTGFNFLHTKSLEKLLTMTMKSMIGTRLQDSEEIRKLVRQKEKKMKTYRIVIPIVGSKLGSEKGREDFLEAAITLQNL